jgi:hypothetical protein
MSISTSKVMKAIEQFPVLPQAPEGATPCALAAFGCTGTVAPDRIVAILPDGTKLGNCANYLRHTQIVREAGAGSEPQRLFTWLIAQFQKANPGRVRGDRSPINTVDLRRAKPAQA